MSTGILTTRPGNLWLRGGRGRRVAQRPRNEHEEKPSRAGDKSNDPEHQPDDRQRAAADRAAAGRDPLPRDESHDRGGRPEDDAETPDRADDRDDADDKRCDGEAVRALRRVSVPGRRVAAGRWRHVAPAGRLRWHVSTARRRGRWRVAPARRRGWRRRVASARRRRRRRGRGFTARWRRRRRRRGWLIAARRRRHVRHLYLLVTTDDPCLHRERVGAGEDDTDETRD